MGRRLEGELRACVDAMRIERVRESAELAAALQRESWDALVLASDASITVEQAAQLVRSSGRDVPLLSGSEAALGGALRKLRRTMDVRTAELSRAHRALRARDEQLRHAQKMEVIGNFAGGIAHDFNNIVLSIGGYAAMLLQDWPQGQPGREDIEEIVRSAEQAQALTRQLLGFARKEAHQPKVLDLAEVIRAVDQLLRRSAGGRVRVEVQIQPHVRPILSDANQIQQVLLNLVLNARDAMPKGGAIRVSVGEVSVSAPLDGVDGTIRPGDWVCLSVKDEGVGMDETTRRRALEPFFTTKPAGRGTGLGLSIVHEILRRAEAHLRLSTAPGQGTTFDIYFPPAEVAESERFEVDSHADGQTILLVEDQPALVALVSRLLEREGYVVQAAGSAEQAIEFARAGGPLHLLLTDVVLPGRNGRELAEEIAELRPGVPTLFMSGYADDVIQRAGLDMGRSRILDKPFLPEDLYECVREAIAAGVAMNGNG